MKKLFDTSLPEMWSKGLFEEKCYDLAAEHMDKILYTLFTATGQLLNGAKSMERAAAFTFERMDNTLIAAAIVEYFVNEDNPDKPGNWSFVWTFDETDIPENALRISIKDPQTHSYFRSIAGDKWGLTFKDAGCLIVLQTYTLEQIYKWLDENASEKEEVGVSLDAVFQARVAVEGGVKVFALEPAGEIKELIKGDAMIEK